MAYYKKTLTVSDLKKFNVQKGLLRRLQLPGLRPGSEQVIQVFDESLGKKFTFHLKLRPLDLNKAHYYHKPEFMARGWTSFVAEKKLKVGQTICFWKPDDVALGGPIKVRIEN